METPSKVLPLVSVIIPVFNREDVIARAIRSVLDQTYEALEIIVVDDGSTDQTVETCKEFGDRIRLIHQENAGPAAARNRGIYHSRGEYIAFLDSDDEWYPRKIEKQVRFSMNGELPVVITDSEINHPDHTDTTFQKSLFSKELKADNKQVMHLFNWILIQNFIHLSTVLIKKESLVGAGLFDETMWIAEDTDLWLRVSRTNRVGVLNEVLAKRDVRPDKLSGDKIKEFEGRVYSFLKLLNQKKLSDAERKSVLERTIWVHGRLIYRSLANKDFNSFRRACVQFVPRLFNRKFYNGINSERSSKLSTAKKRV